MKKIILPMVPLLMTAVGCETLSPGLEPVQEYVRIVQKMDFLAEAGPFSKQDTKTSMDEENRLLWTEGDEISIFQHSDAMDRYLLSGGAGTDKGLFSYVPYSEMPSKVSGAVRTEIPDHVALYPYSDHYSIIFRNGSYEISGLSMPALQQYCPMTFEGAAFPMAAVSSTTTLDFKNLCGVLELQLTGDVILKSLRFSGNQGEPLAGNARLSVASAGLPVLTMSDDAVSSVLLDCGEGVPLATSPSSFYFVLPPLALEKGFTVLVEDLDGNTALLKTGKAQKIVRNGILSMPVCRVDPKAPVINLSADGTANSYIVSSPGRYRFRADVKGNGSNAPVAGSESPLLSGIDRAEVLWEAYGENLPIRNGALIRELTCEGGEITFTVNAPFKAGNALIAACDASGKILWSWHIWMPETPLEECVHANGKGVLMDRNLGAVSSVPGKVGSMGLLYQWGRKDPFLASGALKTGTVHESTAIWPESLASSALTGTIAYAKENPLQFLSATKEGGETGDWYHFKDGTVDNTRWNTIKTIYDPCPAGWKVADGGVSGIWYNVEQLNASFDLEKAGILFPAGYSGKISWYPASGYRGNAGDFIAVGYSGSCWSSTPVTFAGHRFEAYFLFYDQDNYFYSDEYGFRSEARAVRCQKNT